MRVRSFPLVTLLLPLLLCTACGTQSSDATIGTSVASTLTAVSSSAQPTPFSTALPTGTPTQVPRASPTAVPASTPQPDRLDGWDIIPVDVTKAPIGEGWARLLVTVAVRNRTGVWSAFNALHFAVTAAEGYIYECQSTIALLELMPPGFQVRGVSFQDFGTKWYGYDVSGPALQWSPLTLECEVAEESSGYHLAAQEYSLMAIGHGTVDLAVSIDIDLEDPLPTLTYPVAPTGPTPIYSVGEVVELLDQSTLTLARAARTSIAPDSGISGELVALSWTLTNPGGYQAEFEYTACLLGDDGIMYCLPSGFGFLRRDCLSVGPGETISVDNHIAVPNGLKDLYVAVHGVPVCGGAPDLQTERGYVFDLTWIQQEPVNLDDVSTGESDRELDGAVPDPAGTSDRWTRPADGMVMVNVPAGQFQMGSTDDELDDALELCEMYGGCYPVLFERERPEHTISLDAFWIDQTEVTVAQFRAFVEATGYRTTAEQQGYGIVWVSGEKKWEHIERADWRQPQVPGTLAQDDYPVTQVSWHDAAAFCQWAGGQLPTEAQWEYAARGSESLIYPWGDEFDGTRLNYCDFDCDSEYRDSDKNDGYTRAAPTGRYPSGESWCGTLDMAGNVCEWVADWYRADYYKRSPTWNPLGPSEDTGERVNRGGSWLDDPSIVRSAFRNPNAPEQRYDVLGFRCARDS